MSFKRLIFMGSFLFVLVPFLFAQKSASATMKVSVRVIEGASVEISDETPFAFNFDKSGGGIFKLANVEILHAKGNRISIEKPSVLNLINESGEKINLNVVELEGKTGDDGLSYQLGLTEKDQKIKKGKYKGSLTTSITYI